MLSFLSRRRLSVSFRKSRPAIIEGLEARQLLAAGPILTGVQILGPFARAYGIVLTFNESLAPGTAQAPASYAFGKPIPNSSDNGSDLGTILGFLLFRPLVQAVKNGKIQFLGGQYNDANHTVTLTPVKPFNVWRFFRILRVRGTGSSIVTDTAGDPLNGGADTVLHWARRQGKVLKYSDSDGDRVTITLKGPGHLYGFFHKSGDPFPSIFVTKTSAKSSLIGAVQTSPTGDGIAHIAQLSGAIPANTNMFSNTQIDVQYT